VAIATLTIDINAKLASLERDMGKAAHIAEQNAKKMEAAYAGVGKTLKNISSGILGAFSVNLFVGLIKSAIDAQDNLKDLSKSTSISIEDLAGLGTAALKSGSDLESVAASINKLSANMGKDGQKFADIGITAKEPIEAFKQLADVYNAIQDPQEKAAFGAAALGKSWAGAAPLLAEGSQSIGEMVSKGRELSKVTAESAAAADELNDRLVDLKTISGSVTVQFANLLVPSLIDTAKAMEELASKGNPVLSLLRGFAGLGKIPFDLAIPKTDLSSKGQIEDLKASLNDLETKREKLMASGGGFLNQWVYGKQGDLDQKIQVTRNQLALLEKYGEKLDNRNAKPTVTDLGSPNLRASAPDVQKFLGNTYDPAKPRAAKAKKEEPYKDLLTPAAEAYAKAIESINSAQSDAEKSTMGLNSAQEALYDLMNSPTWQDMPDTWKEVAIAQSQAGSAAIKTAEDYKKLNDLLAATPTAKLEETRNTMIFLADAFDAGKISAEQFSEAATAALGSMPEAAKEATDAMEEFAKQAARNMQDAFADFLFDPFEGGINKMLENFGTMVKKLVANAVAADLTSRLFGKSGGGEGSGLLGAGLDWLKGLMPNAAGGVYASPGLSAYSGSIVSRPTVFPFAKGIGLMGEAGAEAILPLKRGADGKLGVTGGGSGHTINVYVQGTSAPDVRRSAGQGAREGIAFMNGAGRYT